MTEVSELRRACAEAVRIGGKVLLEKWGKKRTVEFKGGIDLVTDADKASEAAVLSLLTGEFPEASILAEESGASGDAQGSLRFYVDPLDGTTNYAHGVPHFAVTVGVADRNGLAAGAILDPLRGELFTAARGEGATLGETRIAHSARGELTGSLLVTGFPYDIHEEHELPLRLFGALIRKARAVRRFGSAAIDLAYVACGRFDGFWEQKLKPWDLAAGILLAQEVGAVATDFEGKDRMLHSGDIVVAPPVLHGRILEVIRGARQPS